jgi:hypothetical protein
MACEQGLKEPRVRFSINQLADRSGVARQQVKEDIDYLHNIRIETNSYEIRENGLKEGKIRSYYLLNEVEKDYYERAVKGRTVTYTRTYGVWLHPRLFEILKEKGALRYFPLDAKIMHTLTEREVKLYMIIFNEMLGRNKWTFRLGDLRQQLSMTTNDIGKIKREIRRLMKGLIDKGTGIKRYDLDDRLLTVYGSLKGKVAIEAEYSEVKEPNLIAEVTERLQPTKDKGNPIEEAKKCLSKIAFTKSQINQYAERYYKRVLCIYDYIQKQDSAFNGKAGGWLRNILNLKSKDGYVENCIGQWDADYCVAPEIMKEWVCRIENYVSKRMKQGDDKSTLRRKAIVDLLYRHKISSSDIKDTVSYIYGDNMLGGIDAELEKFRVELSRQHECNEKKRQQEALDKEIAELKNNKQIQKDYVEKYMMGFEALRRAKGDKEQTEWWTAEMTRIKDMFKKAGLDLGVMVQEEELRVKRVRENADYDDDA